MVGTCNAALGAGPEKYLMSGGSIPDDGVWVYSNAIILVVVAISAAVVCGNCGSGGSAIDGGSVAVCGDGVVGDDELCDDGNLIAGDGCSPGCVPSGLPYDCVELLARDSLDDWDLVLDLLPLSDGSFIAAGQLDVGSKGRGWIARYESSGARQWFLDTTSLDADFTRITDLAGDEESGIWALAPRAAFALDNRLIRLDADGNLISATAARYCEADDGGCCSS